MAWRSSPPVRPFHIHCETQARRKEITFLNNIYGIMNHDINTVAYVLERTLNRDFKPRNSSFIGGHYLASSEDWNEEFKLMENFNEIEDAWDFPAFKEYPLILQVSLSKQQTTDYLHQVENTIEQITDLKITLLEKYENKNEGKS